MEAFFVVVTACVLLGFAVWALVALRHLLDLRTDSSQRRPGDE